MFLTNCDDAGVSGSTIQYQVAQSGENLLEKIYINVKDTKLTKKFERFEQHSNEQRAEVEASKKSQKEIENFTVVSNPEPIPMPENSYDFSFLPTFREESSNQSVEP